MLSFSQKFLPSTLFFKSFGIHSLNAEYSSYLVLNYSILTFLLTRGFTKRRTSEAVVSRTSLVTNILFPDVVVNQ